MNAVGYFSVCRIRSYFTASAIDTATPIISYLMLVSFTVSHVGPGRALAFQFFSFLPPQSDYHHILSWNRPPLSSPLCTLCNIYQSQNCTRFLTFNNRYLS